MTGESKGKMIGALDSLLVRSSLAAGCMVGLAIAIQLLIVN
jgi:hypothetical protein